MQLPFGLHLIRPVESQWSLWPRSILPYEVTIVLPYQKTMRVLATAASSRGNQAFEHTTVEANSKKSKRLEIFCAANFGSKGNQDPIPLFPACTEGAQPVKKDVMTSS
jgi:hypothetical protein